MANPAADVRKPYITTLFADTYNTVEIASNQNRIYHTRGAHLVGVGKDTPRDHSPGCAQITRHTRYITALDAYLTDIAVHRYRACITAHFIAGRQARYIFCRFRGENLTTDSERLQITANGNLDITLHRRTDPTHIAADDYLTHYGRYVLRYIVYLPTKTHRRHIAGPGCSPGHGQLVHIQGVGACPDSSRISLRNYNITFPHIATHAQRP